MAAAMTGGADPEAALSSATLSRARHAALASALATLEGSRARLLAAIGAARAADIEAETAALKADIAARRATATGALKRLGEALGGEFTIADLDGGVTWAASAIGQAERLCFELGLLADTARHDSAGVGRDTFAAFQVRERQAGAGA
jgi:hypothetical protein